MGRIFVSSCNASIRSGARKLSARKPLLCTPIAHGREWRSAIPDALAKRIIAETIAPKVRQGDIAGGVAAGVTEIGRLIDGEALTELQRGLLERGAGALRADGRNCVTGEAAGDAWV